MAMIDQADKHSRELGKLICEREGLDPDKVLAEWEWNEAGEGRVMVTLRLPVFMSRAEFDELNVKAEG